MHLLGLKRVLGLFSGKNKNILEKVDGFSTVLDKNTTLDAKTLMSLGNNHEFLSKMKTSSMQVEMLCKDIVQEHQEFFRPQFNKQEFMEVASS